MKIANYVFVFTVITFITLVIYTKAVHEYVADNCRYGDMVSCDYIYERYGLEELSRVIGK